MDTFDASLNFEWKSCPLLDYPKRSGGLLFIILLFLIILYFVTKSFLFTSIAFLLFLSALHNIFFPTYYKLNENGIFVRHIGIEKEYDWGYFKRVYPFKTGIFLSPFEYDSRLDSFRGLYLYTNKKTDKQKLEEFIKFRLTKN